MIWSLLLQGLIQGLTEFLPVSSSGHLLLVQSITKFKESPLFIDLLLHFATLLVILFFYRKRLLKIARTFFKSPFNLKLPDTKIIYLMIIATIPTSIIGLIIKTKLEFVFTKIETLIITWPITAILVFVIDKIKNTNKELEDMSIKDALIIGILQGLGVFPGISRSGITIFGGVILGYKRKDTAFFSFLIAIPAIIGAMLLEILEKPSITLPLYSIILVFLLTFITGFIGLSLLIRMLTKVQFKFFSFYLLVLVIGLSIYLFLL